MLAASHGAKEGRKMRLLRDAVEELLRRDAERVAEFDDGCKERFAGRAL